MDMLHSFIAWYVQAIKLSVEKQRAEIGDDEQIVVLDQLINKITCLVEI